MRNQDDAPARRDADELHDEREPIVRWSRLGVGAGLIVIAIVLIVVENHFGSVGTPAATPVPSTVATPLPAMATPVTADGMVVEPKFVGRRDTAGNMTVQTGNTLLVIAVRVLNHGTRAGAVAPSDFRVEQAGHVLATGQPYPDHPNSLPAPALKPGASAEGILVFDVPRDGRNLELTFRHGEGSAEVLASWQLP